MVLQAEPLTADVSIAVTAGVHLEFREGGVRLSLGAARLDPGPYALTVLELFREPRTMTDAMAQFAIRERNPKVWMQLSSTIYELWNARLLRPSSGAPGVVQKIPIRKAVAKSGVHSQARMLNDRTRTHGFLRAIRDMVKPGDVVIDLGTGTGVLAIAAARAGAKHVYAIEMTGMAEVAAAMFTANGVGDKITLLRGRSNHLDLPGGIRADVLITETVGDGPFGEGILESVSDARERLLKSDARIIPGGITVGVVPLHLPQDLLERYIFTAANAEAWTRDYDIDFSATLQSGDPDRLTQDLSIYRLRTADYLRCETLASPTVLTRLQFASHKGTAVTAAAEMKIAKPGTMHGVAMYFDLDIGAGQSLSTAPAGTQLLAVTKDNSWRIPIWLRLQPLAVAVGEIFDIRFTYADQVGRLEVERKR